MSRKQIAFFWGVFLFVIFGSIVGLKIGQGYRPDFINKTITHTGLLVATSIPDGSQLYLNQKLKSATNTTLDLNPGPYEIEIKKEGFHPWKKQILIEKGLVKKTEAYLFSAFPNLKAVTFTGATNPVLSPDGLKVAFSVNSASALTKNGLWVLDLTDLPLGLTRESLQIMQNMPTKDFSKAEISWSPDSKEILTTFGKKMITESYLLAVNKLTLPNELKDITLSLNSLKQRWQKEQETRNQTQISKLPEKLLETLGESITAVKFAPDENKILYEATASASIPEGIISSLPARNNQPETRKIEPGKIYIYDLQEDKNFYIADKDEEKKISWLGTSRHLFWVEKGKIRIGEYDNTNWVDVYTGSFENLYAFPYPSANKILILTSIGKDTPPNLYAVILR